MEIRPWHFIWVLVALVAGVATFFVSSNLLRRKEIDKQMALPSQLDQRAETFTRAWLRNDWAQLRRLVRPGMDKSAYSWSVHNAAPESLAAEDIAGALRIEAVVANLQAGRAAVTIRLGEANGESARPLYEFEQSWEEVGGNWYFVLPQ